MPQSASAAEVLTYTPQTAPSVRTSPRLGSRLVRRLPLITLALLIGVAAAGCSHDGRTLRAPQPDQNASVSVPSTTTAEFTDPDATLPGAIDSAALGGTLPALLDDVHTIVAAWRDGTPIDVFNTCDGPNAAPALSWSAAPEGTAEIAISMVDDDAPLFDHWTMAGIAPDVSSIAEGEVPVGAFQGTNGTGAVGYAGPCPPKGTTHTYRFTVHYLDQQIELGDGVTGSDLLVAINGSTSAYAEITGTYSRP